MKIAIPVAQGQLCQHFGHCEQFAIIDVAEGSKEISKEEMVTPPPHEPGLLPKWLAEHGVTCVIAGGMGARAIGLFQQFDIKVITGATPSEPKQIVMKFLNDALVVGNNSCDH